MPHILHIDDPQAFRAEVLNDRGDAIYYIHGREIIQSGVMCSENDVEGLARYLSRLKVIPHGASIIRERRRARRRS